MLYLSVPLVHSSALSFILQYLIRVQGNQRLLQIQHGHGPWRQKIKLKVPRYDASWNRWWSEQEYPESHHPTFWTESIMWIDSGSTLHLESAKAEKKQLHRLHLA